MFRSIVQKTRSHSNIKIAPIRQLMSGEGQRWEKLHTDSNTYGPPDNVSAYGRYSSFSKRNLTTVGLTEVGVQEEGSSDGFRKRDRFPLKLAELMVLHRATKALSTACNLGIFDFLDIENDARTPREIGKHCKSSVNGITRLLEACVALDLLNKVDDGEGKYELTDDSRRYLTKSSPTNLRGEIACVDMEYMLTGNLEHAVRDGTTQWPRTLGVPDGGNLFDMVYSNEMFTLQFLASMHGVSNIASPVLVENINLEEFSKVCDLGGGTGAFAYHAVARYPEMNMSVLELPPAVQASSHFIPPGLPQSQLSRVKFIAGDFFKDDLPEAELYVLGRILHNWGGELCDLLLGKVYEALPPGGAVLLVEALLDDDKCGPVRVHLESLVMLAATGDGKERSGEEYKELLTKHGFVDVTVFREGTLLDGVLARKPT